MKIDYKQFILFFLISIFIFFIAFEYLVLSEIFFEALFVILIILWLFDEFFENLEEELFKKRLYIQYILVQTLRKVYFELKEIRDDIKFWSFLKPGNVYVYRKSKFFNAS